MELSKILPLFVFCCRQLVPAMEFKYLGYGIIPCRASGLLQRSYDSAGGAWALCVIFGCCPLRVRAVRSVF